MAKPHLLSFTALHGRYRSHSRTVKRRPRKTPFLPVEQRSISTQIEQIHSLTTSRQSWKETWQGSCFATWNKQPAVWHLESRTCHSHQWRINKFYFKALQQPRKFNKNNKFIKNANFYTVTSAIPSRSLIGWLEFQRTNIWKMWNILFTDLRKYASPSKSRARSAFIKAQESPPYGPGSTHFSGFIAQAKKGWPLGRESTGEAHCVAVATSSKSACRQSYSYHL